MIVCVQVTLIQNNSEIDKLVYNKVWSEWQRITLLLNTPPGVNIVNLSIFNFNLCTFHSLNIFNFVEVGTVRFHQNHQVIFLSVLSKLQYVA